MNEQIPRNALTTLRAGASPLLPIYPQTFEDVARLARMACIAGMVKPLKIGYGDTAQMEDSNSVEARATMLILQGMEVGLPPMQSIQLIAMINGRMVIHSEGVPAILQSKGFKIDQKFVGVEFEDNYKAVCTLTRPNGEYIVSEFSVKDAKVADLWDPAPTKTSYGKTKPNDSAWHCYPKRMLWARALGFAAKDKGSDALKGLMIREEMEDMLRSSNAIDVTPPAPAIATEPPDPDKQPDTTASDVSDIPTEQSDEIADARGLLDKLQYDLDTCSNDAEKMEVWEGMSELIGRLSETDQHEAETIFERT